MLEIITRWLLYRRWLYLTVGSGAFAFLIFELSIPNIPKDAAPDYLEIEAKYGSIAKAIAGYIVDRFASGTNYLNVAIVLVILIYCLYLEKRRFDNAGKTFNFFGFYQNINQTFNEDGRK
jgi:hypothetical protein